MNIINVINILLGMAQERAKKDIESLYYEIHMAIRELLDNYDIADVDRTTGRNLLMRLYWMKG